MLCRDTEAPCQTTASCRGLSNVVDDIATMISTYQTILEHVDFRSTAHSSKCCEETFSTP